METRTYTNRNMARRQPLVTLGKLFTVFLLSFFLFSCDHFDDMEDIIKDEEKKTRFFVADLHPLNNSGVEGTATFWYGFSEEHGEDVFYASVEAENLVPNMVHPQHIHGFEPGANGETGDAECPPMSAAGEDGLLTLEEGLPFYGPVLIPLDNNLFPIEAGEFPEANQFGQLDYFEFLKLAVLIAELDSMFEGEQTIKDLNLKKRSVVLHGAFVKNGEIVPPGTEGAEYVATLPVACGEIIEIDADHNEEDCPDHDHHD